MSAFSGCPVSAMATSAPVRPTSAAAIVSRRALRAAACHYQARRT